jgi:hypothetical protein
MDSGVEQTIALMRQAASAMRSPTASAAETFTAIQFAINSLEAQKADVLDDAHRAKTYEVDGASSIATWARNLAGLDATSTRQAVRAARTMINLPKVGQAARAGQLSAAHVHAFTFGLKHVDHDTVVATEAELLEVAKAGDAKEFFQFLRHARDQLHEDKLDEAWLNGMDKEDLRCTPTAGGYDVGGFFGPDLGAKFAAFQKSASAPRDADDDRTPAERRIEAFDAMLSAFLAHGLPADNGVRPHLQIEVEAEWLKAHYAEAAKSGKLDLNIPPAHLEGFGSIGPNLMDFLLCGADLTPILIEKIGPNLNVLDVGHTIRCATKKQAIAVKFRQRRRCACCRHPISNIHHVTWHSHGGATDLDNLIGLCRKCHTLVHQERITITGTYATGFTIAKTRTGPHARAG